MLDMNEIKEKFSGEIILKNDHLYDELRAVYSANIDKKPAAILICNNESDVIAAVKYSMKVKVPVAVRCA